MKKLTRFILNKCLSLPIPIHIYSLIDLYSSFAQGLGWGSVTIKQEINACLSLLRNKPKNFIDIGANKDEFRTVLFGWAALANKMILQYSDVVISSKELS